MKHRFPVCAAVLLLGLIAGRILLVPLPRMELPFEWSTDDVQYFPPASVQNSTNKSKQLGILPPVHVMILAGRDPRRRPVIGFLIRPISEINESSLQIRESRFVLLTP